jgi:hypothetical protein
VTNPVLVIGFPDRSLGLAPALTHDRNYIMDPVYQSADGDVSVAINEHDSIIYLKAVGSFSDPVELTPETARELAHQLLAMAELLD